MIATQVLPCSINHRMTHGCSSLYLLSSRMNLSRQHSHGLNHKACASKARRTQVLYRTFEHELSTHSLATMSTGTALLPRARVRPIFLFPSPVRTGHRKLFLAVKNIFIDCLKYYLYVYILSKLSELFFTCRIFYYLKDMVFTFRTIDFCYWNT